MSQHWQVIYIRLILASIIILAISVASTVSGHVQTHNTYYTEGGVVAEDTDINNMTYANHVSIYRDSLFAEADAVLADNGTSGTFKNHILTFGEGNGFGAEIKATSDKQFDYHRSFAAGAQASEATALSYTLQSGRTKANYFTDGGNVNEDITVDNVKYVNAAKIQPYLLSGSGSGDLVEGIGVLADNILVNPYHEDTVFGTNFVGAAQVKLNYQKSFNAGFQADNQADVSYTIDTGISNANYFNPSTHIEEAVLTDACMYKSLIKNSANNIDSSGQGAVARNSPSRFIDQIGMTYEGRSSLIHANLTTGLGIYGSRTDLPVRYTWNTLVESNSNSSKDAIAIAAYNGNRNINMTIVGKAQGLTDKYAGPLYLSPFGFIGVSKELYMSYEINR